MKGLLNKPSRIATLLKLFQQTPPRGVADNEQVGGALSRLAQNIRPQDPNNMLEEFANLPGHALANTIDAGAALIQPDQLVKAAQQVYRDPQPAIQGLKDFGAEVAERPVALMEQLDLTDLIPGLAALPPGSNKFLKTLGKNAQPQPVARAVAVKLKNGEIIEGWPGSSHHSLYETFAEDRGLEHWSDEVFSAFEGKTDGFITPDGKFISSAEAGRRIRASTDPNYHGEGESYEMRQAGTLGDTP